jgi:hypothetical protein
VTDLFLLASKGGLIGLAEATARSLEATAQGAANAGVIIQSAETIQLQDSSSEGYQAGTPVGRDQLVAIGA